MKKICMVAGKGGYTTPITKRTVVEGVPFSCSEEEAEKLLQRGFFFEVVEEDQLDITGLLRVAQAPDLSLPKDWSGRSILIEVPGGIGDAIIACSVARYLKQSPCMVAVKPSPPAEDFIRLIEEVDEVSSTLRRDKFDIVLSLADFLKSGPQVVYDGCFHFRAFQFLRIENPVIRLPTIKRATPSPAVTTLLDPKKRTVAFHTDASAAHRCWFDNNWKSLFKKLGDNFNKVVLGKGSFTKRFGGDVIDASHLSVVDQVTIAQTAELVVCVDSCFLHVAGVCNTPTLALLGPSRKENCARMYTSVSAIQADCPCGKVYLHPKDCQHEFACQKNLSLNEVVSAVNSRLGISLPKAKVTPRVSSGGVPDLLRRQRVLVVFPHYLKGGGEVATLEVTRQLKRYFDVTVVAYNNYRVRHQPTIKNELVTEFGATILEDNEIESEFLSQFDTILFYGMNERLCISLRSLTRRPTTVRVVHTSYPVEGSEFTKTWGSVIDKTLCVNPGICQDIPGSSFTPNPVSVSKLSGGKKKFFSGDKPVLGFIGRFDGNKRIAWLVRAMRDLDANLIIQGMDSDSLTKDQLTRIAYESGSSEKIHFVPPSDDVGTTLRSCDALCLLSEEEALPMVVLEAGWVGTPVVCTKVGSLPSLFPKEVTFVKFTGNGKDCQTSLKRIVHRIKQGEFPVAHRTQSMQTKVQELCNPENVGSIYRKAIREVFGKSLSLPPTIKLVREQGIGDIVMATALIRKVIESTNSPIVFHTSETMKEPLQKTFPSITVSTGKCIRKEFNYVDYGECWRRGEHIVEGMGGAIAEVGVWVPKRTTRHKGRQGHVGIMPFSNAGAPFKSKELPLATLQSFISSISSEYKVHQLGHISEPLLDGVVDKRVSTFYELVDTFSRMRHIVAVEGLANHIGYLLGKPIMVIVGGSSSAEISSYDIHHNVKTPSSCRCWASILTREVGKACARLPKEAPCMQAISTDFLVDEFQKYSKRV